MTSLLQDLRVNGVAVIPEPWPKDCVAAFVSHLQNCVVYDGHVPLQGNGTSRRFSESADLEFCSVAILRDTIQAPHIFDYALQFFPLLDAYLEAPAQMYSLHSFWTRPGARPATGVQAPHTDTDDTKFIALFMYGTDVLRAEDGAHVVWGRDGVPRTLLGPAGTCFFIDPTLRHMGIKPQHRERLLTWVRWGVSECPEAYKWDQLQPVDEATVPLRTRPSAQIRAATKLVINWRN